MMTVLSPRPKMSSISVGQESKVVSFLAPGTGERLETMNQDISVPVQDSRPQQQLLRTPYVISALSPHLTLSAAL